MKFTSLKRRPTEELRIRELDGGTVTSRPAYMIEKNQLSEGCNVWAEGGGLCSRPGLKAGAENVIKNSYDPYIFFHRFTAQSQPIFIDGEYKKIVVEHNDYAEQYILNIFLTDGRGITSPAGSIPFGRVSSESFYAPDSVLFISGTPKSGSGIYALITTVNRYDTDQKDFIIYELSQDKLSWSRCIDYYIPTVYINGRGNLYEEFASSNFVYKEKPRVIESLNLLTPSFRAYFTSDGHSSSFRLPFAELNSDSVILRYYIAPNSYAEWVIPSGESTDSVSLFGTEITLRVDRVKGLLSFTNPDGDYPVPLFSGYPENNICVLAGKATAGAKEALAGLSILTRLDKRLLLSGGDTGRIICINPEKPLYFPSDSLGTVGETNVGITALLSYGNKILAFKEREIYSADFKNGERLNAQALLADNGDTFYQSDRLEAEKISDGIGCKYGATAAIAGKNAVFLGQDKRVYTLSLAGTVKEISENISDTLIGLTEEQFYNAFSFIKGNYYFLIMENKSVIMYLNGTEQGSKPAYFWDFGGIEAFSFFGAEDKLWLLCRGSDKRVFYAAQLSGENDTDLVVLSGELAVLSCPIFCSVRLKEFDFGDVSSKKFIESISFAAASGSELSLRINGGRPIKIKLSDRSHDYSCGTLKAVRLNPCLFPVGSLCVAVSSASPFSIRDFAVRFSRGN